jgi:eukaryotic-like serine/threonine-protein kinase
VRVVPSISWGAGNLYPAYVRGLAYLAAHRGVDAAGEFQKILDHRGIVVSGPIGALARWQLGRAYAVSGDRARAKSAYDSACSRNLSPLRNANHSSC